MALAAAALFMSSACQGELEPILKKEWKLVGVDEGGRWGAPVIGGTVDQQQNKSDIAFQFSLGPDNTYVDLSVVPPSFLKEGENASFRFDFSSHYGGIREPGAVASPELYAYVYDLTSAHLPPPEVVQNYPVEFSALTRDQSSAIARYQGEANLEQERTGFFWNNGIDFYGTSTEFIFTPKDDSPDEVTLTLGLSGPGLEGSTSFLVFRYSAKPDAPAATAPGAPAATATSTPTATPTSTAIPTATTVRTRTPMPTATPLPVLLPVDSQFQGRIALTSRQATFDLVVNGAWGYTAALASSPI
jgi:hypothetical protein